jgi:hypothetical protein
MAAAQARYDEAKSQWLQAAKQAQSHKDEARTEYDRAKADGYANASSFTEWVPMNVRLEPFSTCMLC